MGFTELSTHKQVHVGEWVLNLDQQTISDGVITTELEPLLFKLLSYFVQHNTRIISRQELVEKVWEQSFVDDNAINRAISELRKVLKSPRQPGQSIKTHYRKGYSLFVEVHWPSPQDAPSGTPMASDIHADTPEVARVPQAAAPPNVPPVPDERPASLMYRIRPLLLGICVLPLIIAFAALYLSGESLNATPKGLDAQAPLELRAQPLSWHRGTHGITYLTLDKSRLVYQLTRKNNGVSQVHVLDLNTQRDHSLNIEDVNRILGWSIDGQRLFYQVVNDSVEGAAGCEVWQVSNVLSAHPEYTSLFQCDEENSMPSLHGMRDNKYVYAKGNFRGIRHLTALYQLDLSTGEEIRISSPAKNGWGDHILGMLDNPQRIVFERINPHGVELYITSVDGHTLTKLTEYDYRAWVTTWDRENNHLLWYQRHTQSIEAYDLNKMQRLPGRKAEIAQASYAYPLSHQSLLTTTYPFEPDSYALTLSDNRIRAFERPGTEERRLVYLGNNQYLFDDEGYYHPRQIWRTTVGGGNVHYENISASLPAGQSLQDIDLESQMLLTYAEKAQTLHLYALPEFTPGRSIPVEQTLVRARYQDKQIALITADKLNGNNSLFLFDLATNTLTQLEVKDPSDLDWIDAHRLLIGTSNSQVFIYNLSTRAIEQTLDLPQRNSPLYLRYGIKVAAHGDNIFVAGAKRILTSKIQSPNDFSLVYDALSDDKPRHTIRHIHAQEDQLMISVYTYKNNEIQLYTPK